MNEEIQQVQSLSHTAAELIRTAEQTTSTEARDELLHTASSILELVDVIVHGSDECDEEDEVLLTFAELLESLQTPEEEDEDEEEGLDLEDLDALLEAVVTGLLAVQAEEEEFDLGLEECDCSECRAEAEDEDQEGGVITLYIQLV